MHLIPHATKQWCAVHSSAGAKPPPPPCPPTPAGLASPFGTAKLRRWRVRMCAHVHIAASMHRAPLAQLPLNMVLENMARHSHTRCVRATPGPIHLSPSQVLLWVGLCGAVWRGTAAAVGTARWLCHAVDLECRIQSTNSKHTECMAILGFSPGKGAVSFMLCGKEI